MYDILVLCTVSYKPSLFVLNSMYDGIINASIDTFLTFLKFFSIYIFALPFIFLLYENFSQSSIIIFTSVKDILPLEKLTENLNKSGSSE